jgi:CTD kinase subunit beta
MLEASGFDFRNRHPQDLLIKLCKFYGFDRQNPVVKLSYSICLDLYRTFAPLKHQTATMALACLELAGRLTGEENTAIWSGRDYATWKINRGMVMGTSTSVLLVALPYISSNRIYTIPN